jgi:KEOPS complex subunit Pcc1
VDHDAVLSFDYPDPKRARRVERSVRPEIGAIEGDRTTATLDRSGATVTVRIEATDLVALRAGLNTWSTLVAVAERAGLS